MHVKCFNIPSVCTSRRLKILILGS